MPAPDHTRPLCNLKCEMVTANARGVDILLTGKVIVMPSGAVAIPFSFYMREHRMPTGSIPPCTVLFLIHCQHRTHVTLNSGCTQALGLDAFKFGHALSLS